MQKILPPSIHGFFGGRASMYKHLYRFLTLLGVIFIATEIGSCGDGAQNPSSGTSIVFKESNPSGVSIDIKDKTQFEDLIPKSSLKNPIPKVVLNVDPSASNTKQEINVTPATPLQAIVASRTVLPSESSQRKVEVAAETPKASANVAAIDLSPRQAVPPVPAQPVSLSVVNSQVVAASPPQIAMATQVRQVKATDSETKKDNLGQSQAAPAPAQNSQQLPPPPSLEGAAPQPNIPIPSTPSNQSDQKLGEAPPETNLEFLRKETVLLKPCEWQMDIGFSYLVFDNHFTDVVQGTLVETRLRRRLLTTPLEFRYGLFDRVQLFANAPFGWANTEISRVGDDDFANSGGIGDTNVGATIWLHKSNGASYSPDILTTFGMTAPTGNGNALLGILETPNITLGQGFWAGFWSVLAIHKYDPVVVFYGIGGRHYVERDVDQFTGCKPGDQYLYQLGTGFAINERITLSTIFFGSYITEARLNNQVLQGTIMEPMYLRFAVTVTRPNKHFCEPFVEIGLTDDAANARAGITWTF